MAIKLRNIVQDKYMESDIDSLCFHFDVKYKHSYVDEFEVPEKYKYSVTCAQDESAEHPVWIEIVNPQELSRIDSPPLPDIGMIDVDGREVTLLELARETIKQLTAA